MIYKNRIFKYINDELIDIYDIDDKLKNTFYYKNIEQKNRFVLYSIIIGADYIELDENLNYKEFCKIYTNIKKKLYPVSLRKMLSLMNDKFVKDKNSIFRYCLQNNQFEFFELYSEYLDIPCEKFVERLKFNNKLLDNKIIGTDLVITKEKTDMQICDDYYLKF